MSPAAVRISSALPLAAPVSAKPRITQRRRPDVRGERGQRAADGRAQVPARDDRPAPDAVHQPPGRHRREPGGDQEDRGPEPEQALDAGHQHERQRRHRGDELQHRRVHRHGDGQQQRVAPDRDAGERRVASWTLVTRPSPGSRRGRSGPRWRSAGCGRSRRTLRAGTAARRRVRGAGVADRQSARGERAHRRADLGVVDGDRAADAGSSVGQAAAETAAQSSPAIAVPGVATTVGSPAASDAVRHAATSGSTAITCVPPAAPQRAAAAAERADARPAPSATSNAASPSSGTASRSRR